MKEDTRCVDYSSFGSGMVQSFVLGEMFAFNSACGEPVPLGKACGT